MTSPRFPSVDANGKIRAKHLPDGATGTVTSANITDSTSVGRALITASSAAAARGTVGAVATTDSRLTDQRVPTDNSVTDAKIPVGAAIALSKLATDPLNRTNHSGTQASSTISDLPEFIRDTIASFIKPGTNVTMQHDDAGNTFTVNASGGSQLLVRSLWDGSKYPYNGTAITLSRRTGDMAGLYVAFAGDPDPNALGIMIDGDDWQDPTP